MSHERRGPMTSSCLGATWTSNLRQRAWSSRGGETTPLMHHPVSKMGRYQRPYRKDRLSSAYFCCLHLAKYWIVRGICLYNLLHWLVCYKPTSQSFPDFGVLVSVDFDSKYRIAWGETRDHSILYLLLKRWKSWKKNLHNYSNISTPILSDWHKLGWRG